MRTCILIWLLTAWPAAAFSQEWSVTDHLRISATEGADFGSSLPYLSYMGSSMTSPGDLDGDGVNDLVVGARRASGVAAHAGSIFFLFLQHDGSVRQTSRIAVGKGLLEGGYTQEIWFGASVSSLGDLDGDGVSDLAVGQVNGNDWGPQERGIVWILFPNPDGSIKAYQRLGRRSFPAHNSLAGVGDIDGDGVPDLGLGDPAADEGGLNRGGLQLLYLNPDGTVRESSRINSSQGMGERLADGDLFGYSMASIGDLDQNGVPDLAVGAPLSASGGRERGCVWILFLEDVGTVSRTVRIGSGQGGFEPELADYAHFGCSVSNLGDLDGDGVEDLGVGAPYDDASGIDRGALWILLMQNDGSVKDAQKLTGIENGRTWFGYAAASLGDLDGDGTGDLAVGAPLGNDSDGVRGGSLWLLFMNRGSHAASSADFDENGVVDFGDLLLFASAFGSRSGGATYDAKYDLDSDGRINFEDFLLFVQEYAS